MVTESPLRRALHRAPSKTWVDRIGRMSLAAADAKFYPSRDPLIAVELGLARPDAYNTAKLSMALQDATARIGHYLKDPKTTSVQSHTSYRDDAPLISKGSAGNVLYFGFPEPAVDEAMDPLFTSRSVTLAERAAVALLEILPGAPDDDRALDAVLGRHITERAALHHLVSAVHDTGADLGLHFSSEQKTVDSTLSREQATALDSSLKESSIERSTHIYQGVLDGMRTSRRLFYLELESGPDISGAVGEDMLTVVKEHIGLRVRATVERAVVRHKSGRHGRPSYRLVSLERPQTILDELDD